MDMLEAKQVGVAAQASQLRLVLCCLSTRIAELDGNALLSYHSSVPGWAGHLLGCQAEAGPIITTPLTYSRRGLIVAQEHLEMANVEVAELRSRLEAAGDTQVRALGGECGADAQR
jgi:hypothetical protein